MSTTARKNYLIPQSNNNNKKKMETCGFTKDFIYLQNKVCCTISFKIARCISTNDIIFLRHLTKIDCTQNGVSKADTCIPF